jgi:hypothetical protein
LRRELVDLPVELAIGKMAQLLELRQREEVVDRSINGGAALMSSASAD